MGSFILGVFVGIILALLELSRFRIPRWAAQGYIEVFRGTPRLTQLFIIFFGLPYAGIRFSPLMAAILGLGLNAGAYLSEVFRAGIESVHHGQMEAALSIGMTRGMAMRYVILPQALRVVLPPLANFIIGLMKYTALVSTIAAPEIMLIARNLIAETYLSMQIYLLVAAIYFVMAYPLSILSRRLEFQIKRG